MRLFDNLLRPRAATPMGPGNDFWYGPVPINSIAGVRVSPQTAMAISTVYACVRVISQSLSTLPFLVYQRMEPEGKRRAPGHPLYRLLHDRPNVRQTSQQFRQMLTAHILLRGNAYALIEVDPLGQVVNLVPLNPDRMRVRLNSRNEKVFHYLPADGRTVTYLQDEVFHLMGLTDDGVTGISVIDMARTSFGLSAALESYGARLFSQGAIHGGHLIHPGKLSLEAQERLKKDFEAHSTGLTSAHRTLVLEEGLKFERVSLTAEEAQWFESRGTQVEEVASWFGVPLALLQHTEKATTWGTGLEQLTQGFVTYTLQPLVVAWEQQVLLSLFLEGDRHFAEFLMVGLIRGDSAGRAAFYRAMIEMGVLSQNEVRILENLNPVDDPAFDQPVRGGNLGGSGNGGPQPGENTRQGALAAALAWDTAGRVVRKEVATLRKASVKYGGDAPGWATWVVQFYDGQREEVAEHCHVSAEAALGYTVRQRDELLRVGVGVLDSWESSRPGELAGLMLEGCGDKVSTNR